MIIIKGSEAMFRSHVIMTLSCAGMALLKTATILNELHCSKWMLYWQKISIFSIDTFWEIHKLSSRGIAC